jgi:hydroxymethylbilane synthase
VLAALQGGCQAPLGAFAEWREARQLRLVAVVASVHEPRIIRTEMTAIVENVDTAVALGLQAAEDLRVQGAANLLAAAREWIATVGAGDRS